MAVNFMKMNLDDYEAPNTSKCALCKKTVYDSERQRAADGWWHKMCMKCTTCETYLNVKTFQAGPADATGFKPLYCKVHLPKATHTQVADDVHTKRALNAPKKVVQTAGIDKQRDLKGAAPPPAAGTHMKSDQAALAPKRSAAMGPPAPNDDDDDWGDEEKAAPAPARNKWAPKPAAAREPEPEPEPEPEAQEEGGFQPGEHLTAMYEGDGEWYRCVIQRTEPDGMVAVIFDGFEEEELVAPENISRDEFE